MLAITTGTHEVSDAIASPISDNPVRLFVVSTVSLRIIPGIEKIPVGPDRAILFNLNPNVNKQRISNMVKIFLKVDRCPRKILLAKIATTIIVDNLEPRPSKIRKIRNNSKGIHLCIAIISSSQNQKLV